MNEILNFLNNLTTYGNSKVIVETGPNKYRIYSIFIYIYGSVISNIVNVNTDKPLIIEGKVDKTAKIISAMSLDEPDYKYIKEVIAKAISCSYQGIPYAIDHEDCNIDYTNFCFNQFYFIATNMLEISNHNLIRSKSTSDHAYLDSYLMNTFEEKNLRRVELNEIKERAEYLDLRMQQIDTLSDSLKMDKGEAYLTSSNKWTEMYDDHSRQSEYALHLKKY